MQNLIPIQQIPGTNLFTGIFYTVRMKRYPTGFVTYTDATSPYNANYIQIDLNPNNLSHYEGGQKWEKDCQWMFTPTEDPSWYMWDNRVLSSTHNAITNWAYQEVGSGHHIIASKKAEDIGYMSPGGKWRTHGFWKPISVNDGNNYQLKLKHHPNGPITWTDARYGDHSHYIQVVTNPGQYPHYYRGGKWYTDTLFTFIPTGLQLNAKITEFKFQEPPSSILNQHTKSDSESSVLKYTLLNPSAAVISQQIEETFSKTSTYSYGFEQSFKQFAKVSVSASIPLIAQGSAETGFESTVGSNQQFTKTRTREYKAIQNVTLPPYSKVVASIFSEWVEGLEIPFSATMEITGETVRKNRSTKEETRQGVPGELIKHNLTSLGEDNEYEVVNVGDNSVKVNVRGKFKGTFGFRAIVSVEDIKPTD